MAAETLAAIILGGISIIGTWLGARTPKAGVLQRGYIDDLRDDLARMRDELSGAVERIDRLEREREEIREAARQVQLVSDRRALHIDRLEGHMIGHGVEPLPRPEGV